MVHFFDQYMEPLFDIRLLKTFDKIFVLVSGGIDSTLLADWILHHYPDTTYYVNAHNPFEKSDTLNMLSQFERFICITQDNGKMQYGKVLKSAFLKLNEAALLRKQGKYHKHIFQCCRFIKHNAFKNDDLFKQPNTAVVSGIKYTDGLQRRMFLHGIRYCKETTNNMKVPLQPTYFYRHVEGQLYCYPYRDIADSEFPKHILAKIREKYPSLKHSGCSICPVLVLFSNRIKDEEERTAMSMKYLQNLIANGSFKPSSLLLRYCPQLMRHKKLLDC